MNTFASALGKKFLEDKDAVRTRSFELGGHIFKVKVPLTAEYEAILARIAVTDEATIEKYFQELAKPFMERREEFEKEQDIEYTKNDILLKGTSMRETAKNKTITENRILEFFKLIVPEEKDFDMTTITYDMVEELFPFPIQIQIMGEIGNVISPSYKEIKGK
jgi:hypothetical protein